MPFVKIHMSSLIQTNKIKALVSDIRKATVEILQIEETIGQVMLYQTPIQNREAHYSRDINFVYTEIIMYPGRASEIKKRLMEKINELIINYTGVSAKDINCCIVEIPPENWSGGILHPFITEPAGDDQV